MDGESRSSVFSICYAHCLVPHIIFCWTIEHILKNSTYLAVLSYMVEHLDEDRMVHRIVCCIQVEECCTGNHTSLIIIFDVLSQGMHLAGT